MKRLFLQTQTWMKVTLTTLGVLSGISVVILLIVAGIHIPAFGMWFYYWQYGANNTYEVVGMYPEHLHALTRHMIDYLRGNEPYLQYYTYIGGTFRPFFSDIEIRHMVDVRDLVIFSIWLRNIAVILLVVTFGAFFVMRNNAHHIWKYLLKPWKWTAAITFGIVALLAIIISLDWDRAWYIFHEVIFTNEMFFGNRYWLLQPYSDLLINIVPYPFFFTMTVFLAAVFGGGLVAMFVASALLLRRVK